MVAVARITSQGQISIPAEMRKRLKIKTPSSLFITTLGNKIVIEPVDDFSKLAGKLAKNAIKSKTMVKINNLEKEAVREAMIKNAK